MKPTIHEMRAKLAAWYGLPLAEVIRILDTPEHPAEMRDEFAMAAMQHYTFHDGDDQDARRCYEIADAMLEARNANR